MWVFSSLMFSQNYRLFLNIFKVKLLQKLKALGRIFLSFYTELGKQWVKCMQFSCSKISHFLTTTAEVFFLLGTIRFFFVRNFDATLCSYKPWDGGGKKQRGTMRKQTHVILNTKVLLLYILRITSACGCSLSLVSLSGWAIYTERTIQGRWSLLDKQQSISYLEGKKTGMFFSPNDSL